MRRWLQQSAWRGDLFAVLAVALATGVFILGRDYFAKGQWAIFYLLLIVFIANLSGVRAAVIAAVSSFLTWDFFFLPPYHRFIIYDPKDWISLFAFLIVGIVIGVQTGRMREREATARARERETALLNRLSANLVSISSPQSMVEAILEGIRAITQAREAMVFLAGEDGKTLQPQPKGIEIPPAVLQGVQWVAAQHKAIGLPEGHEQTDMQEQGWPISVPAATVFPDAGNHAIFIPLQTATSFFGVLYVGARRDGQPYAVPEAQLLIAAANLVASFLERQQLEKAAFAVEALREADRLKGNIIASVSHELKTPLAAINATVTNLLSPDVHWQPEAMHDELESIHDAAERLSDEINALVDLSRLQADQWHPEKDWYELGEIIGTTVRYFPKAQRARFVFQIPPDLPLIHVDFHQWTRALHHLLENALAYSPEGSPICLSASSNPGEVRICVEDTGPGVPAAERERIFEKFFRGAGSAAVPTGTGLGLAITAEIVREHGGRIWVDDVQPHGARFCIAIPLTGDAA